MQNTLRTVRIQAGLYISDDGEWKIQRENQWMVRGKSWRVYRKSEGIYRRVAAFPTLADARSYIVDSMSGWYL